MMSRMIPIKTAVAETDAIMMPVSLMGLLKGLALEGFAVDDGAIEAIIKFGAVLDDRDGFDEGEVVVDTSTVITELLTWLEEVWEGSVEDRVTDAIGVEDSVEDSVVGVFDAAESAVVCGVVVVGEGPLGRSV